ncbi:MAG: tyrosine-type recombinase/integrase [Bacillota bacterium]
MAKRGHGEGTIRKRKKDGLWEARITVGYDPATGRQKQISKYFKKREDARDWLAKAVNEQATGAFIEPHKVTVGQWLDKWLADYKKLKLKPTTWAGYETLIRCHIKPAIGNIPLNKLQTGELQKLYKEKLEKGRVDGKGGLSPDYVRYMHAVIHEALKQAVKEQLIYRNVAEAVNLPEKEEREMRPLKPEEMDKFLSLAEQDRLYAAFLLELGTGLRRGELLALKWDNVDLKNGVLAVKESLARVKVDDPSKNGGRKTRLDYLDPKTKSSKRIIPIPEDILKELKAHKTRQNEGRLFFGQNYHNENLVFCLEDGKPLDPRNFTRKFERLLRRAGIPKTRFHDLRHTFATRLLELNEHPKVVQELLGHAKITTTIDTYSHVDPELKKKAAARLNELFRRKKGASATEA